jgi:CHASE3 domain sensor protein
MCVQPRMLTLIPAMAAFAVLCGASVLAQASAAKPQDTHHVVSLEDLNADATKAAETRKADEAELRHLLSTDAGQKALKSAKIDYQKVDKAIGQLSDEDLAKLAARSRQAESDFAAGGLTSTLIVAIVLIVVLIVVLSVVF